MAGYLKTPTPYTGYLATVWTGANIDAILSMVAGCGEVTYMNGALKVFGEEINIGDAVCVVDDDPVLPAAKIPASTITTDRFRIDATLYNLTNVDTIAAVVGYGNIAVTGGGLFVNGTLVGDGDAVATAGTSEVFHITAAELASDFLAE